MSAFPAISYFGSFLGFGSSVADSPVAPDEKAKPEDPLERDKYGAASFAWADWTADAPPPNDDTWWRMRQHPGVVFAYALCTLPVCAGTRTATIRTNESQEERTKPTVRTGTGVQVTDTPEEKRRKLVDDLWETLWPDLYPGLEYLNFGRWTAEVQWDRRLGVVAPSRFKSFTPGTVQILRDKFNDFAGYKLGEEERDARYGLHWVCNGHLHDPLFGWPRARNAREAWWRSVKSHRNGDGLEQKASGIQMFLQFISGSFVDANGKALVTKDMAATLANAARKGEVFYAPMTVFDKQSISQRPELADVPAMKVQQLDWGNTGPSLDACLNRLNRLDVEIVRAYHRPEREGMEGEHGTKAEAGTHGAIGTLDSEGIAADWLGHVNRQVVNRFLVTNFGADAADSIYFKQAPLADPQQVFLQDAIKLAMANAAEGPTIMAHIDKRALMERVELPLLKPEQVVEPPPLDPGAGIGGNGDGEDRPNGRSKPVNGMGNGRMSQMGLSADGEDGDVLMLTGDNCGTGAGGFQSGNTCAKGGNGTATAQPRAKAGGEVGPNGEWYPGGAFIATTELSKMARTKRDKAAKGRREIAPYTYEVPPAGKLAIYANLGPGTALQLSGRDPANWRINEEYLRGFQKADDVVVEQAKGMLEKYRAGERYVDANEFYEWAAYDDVARMAVADMPVAGATLERMAKIRGTTVEELQKSLGIKRYEGSGG